MDRLTKLLSRMYNPDPRDARIAELERELAAERERREAAEALLLAICSTMAVNTHNK